ncbi:hypothetical protein EDB80DRAFT_784317 [Ilyonectria destructans]|nr:hypothetical protein EDB80DRAFT_784317 [Ilyonectria destructans]
MSNWDAQVTMKLHEQLADVYIQLRLDIRGGRNTLYARHHFRRFVLDTWLDSAADKGPFVLMHGDMNMLMSNPRWRPGLGMELRRSGTDAGPARLADRRRPRMDAHRQNLFYTEVGRLVAAIRDRERALQIPPRLSQEWAKMETWCHTAVVIALLSPDLTYDVFWDLVFYQVEEPRSEDPDFRKFYMKAIHPRLTAFMETPERKALLARKEEEQRRFFEDEKEYFNNPCAREIAEEGY